MTDKIDIETIVPEEAFVKINGIDCRVKRFRTREFLALTSILTKGLGENASRVRLSGNDDEVASELIGLVLVSLPNAVPEFIAFLQGIVEPVDKADKGKIAAYMGDDPDLDVLIDVFEAFAVQERDEIGQLTGKFRASWDRISSLYQKKTG